MPFGSGVPGVVEPSAILQSVGPKTFKLQSELPYRVRTNLIEEIVTDSEHMIIDSGSEIEGDTRVVSGKKGLSLYAIRESTDGFSCIIVLPHDPKDPESTTDLASIPWFLWSLLGPYGKQLRPALLHDRLCERAEYIRDAKNNCRKARELRRQADAVFRLALSEEQVWWYRRWIFWTGVSFGRLWNYLRPVAWVLIIQIILATLSVYSAVALSLFSSLPLVAALLLIAVPLALPFVWGKNFRLPLVATFAAPIVIPFILASLLSAVLLWLPDIVVWLSLWATGNTTDPFPELLPRGRLVQ